MGQFWAFVNLDARESTGYGKLGEFMPYSYTGSVSSWLLTTLLPYAIEFEFELDALNDKISRRATRSRLGGYLSHLNIPPELLYMIFSELDCLEDVACLCIANSALWVVGIARVLELAWKPPVRCEGQRLIFIGEHSTNLPEGLLNPEEMQRSRGFETFSEFLWKRCTYRSNRNLDVLRRLPWNERGAFILLAYPGLLGDYGFRYPDSYYRERKWVLCNLSKK
ncbi:hypothetical protein NEOLEDRAFT_819218 [Neolentinus lepideus HHB14362 ss-1]|uniref:F-box domain-containing protein n=1 Tax=Neolentinus lepideus HHB14362 ss-1 TaxID=1314782 RepID=A0A165PDK5_9AGAM|nr:hypothetical protein NEOLEDRAFT_819218 [Neolentinus lepideus HHB14362 ss-1]